MTLPNYPGWFQQPGPYVVADLQPHPDSQPDPRRAIRLVVGAQEASLVTTLRATSLPVLEPELVRP